MARAIVLALLAALVAPPIAAAPLLISPTTVQLAPGRHGAVVTVENMGDAAVDLQFSAYAWSQRNGKDHLAETTDVVVSPVIATVPAHSRQLFRILERAVVPDEVERSYRLRLSELAGARQEEVAVRVSFLLPMFGGGAPVSTAPSWQAADGQLTVENPGNRRLRVASLALRLADGRQVALPVVQPTYLLAGSRQSWLLPAAAAGAHLVGVTDTVSFDVPAGTLPPVR